MEAKGQASFMAASGNSPTSVVNTIARQAREARWLDKARAARQDGDEKTVRSIKMRCLNEQAGWVADEGFARDEARRLGRPGVDCRDAWFDLLTGGRCSICCCSRKPRQLAVRHVFPVKSDGAHVPGNLVAVCTECRKVYPVGSYPIVMPTPSKKRLALAKSTAELAESIGSIPPRILLPPIALPAPLLNRSRRACLEVGAL